MLDQSREALTVWVMRVGSRILPQRPNHGWMQKGLVLLIVLSAEAEDLMLAQLLPTTATTSNQ